MSDMHTDWIKRLTKERDTAREQAAKFARDVIALTKEKCAALDERDAYRSGLADLLAVVNPKRRYEKDHAARVETVRIRVRDLLKRGPTRTAAQRLREEGV